jgi:CHAT domain-containing protein
MTNLAGCRFALHEYREAVDAFEEARRLAAAAGDAGTAGAIDANLSSVYEQMGELGAAIEYARRGAERLSGRDRVKHLPKVLIHLASLRARQGRMEDAAPLFMEGIAGADRAGDLDTYAIGWDRLGEERFKAGDLDGAERAMLEAYRVRKLHRLAALGTSYRNLGRLRLAQGDLGSAEALLDLAAAQVRESRGLMPSWDVYHARGQVRMARGRPAEAISEFRTAVRLARVWRAGIPAADAARVSSEQMLSDVYAGLARAAAELHLRTGRPEFLREGVEAVEENRARSLQWLLESGAERRKALPPEYWETLARLQAAEAALVRRPDDSRTGETAQRLRVALVEIENRGASRTALPEAGLTRRLARRLGPDTAFFSFQLSEPASLAWVVDRGGAAVYRLAGRRTLARAAQAFTGAVRQGREDAGPLGDALYAELFGRAPRRFTNKPHWLLALDDALYGAPLGALRSAGAYLVERHTLQVVSGGELVARGGAPWQELLAGPFLGVADPVYNNADSRAAAVGRRPALPFGFLQASGRTGEVELPRLVGSGREVRACAAEWRGNAILLEGTQAGKGPLRAALAGSPAVAHLATHVLPAARRSGDALIALSLAPRRGAQLLDAPEIAAWQSRAGLVVLSGCSSGAGQAVPGTGLMGLTRAWLAAGAGAVAATHWPTPDGTGALLRSLYRHLREDPAAGPAAALGKAQVEMLHAGGWRGRPQYWGAYFVVGNQ